MVGKRPKWFGSLREGGGIYYSRYRTLYTKARLGRQMASNLGLDRIGKGIPQENLYQVPPLRLDAR
jgi:hypothetical protein